MASDLAGAAPVAAAAPSVAEVPAALLTRPDGVYFAPGVGAAALQAAVNQVFLSGAYFAGLDYAALQAALYPPPPPPSTSGAAPAGAGQAIHFATAIVPFEAQRRALYKAPKNHRDSAEYFFEQLFFEEIVLPDGTVIPERPARLDPDEFVAELWLKGIRFGVDFAAVKAAIAAAKSERITVARQRDAAPGTDAMVVEVSQDLHRSDAPRARADGRVDLLSFQNRFPQIKKNMRLLKKQPARDGSPGYELGGGPLPPAPPRDLELAHLAGAGTVVERKPDGEYLVATQDGFLSVDPKSHSISVNDKIVSMDGVSGRTTGNLELAGAYEEFGDVQEQREVSGGDITVHGNVYGNINSRGGHVALNANLVGGSVHNAAGNIEVKGVASSAVLQTRSGVITLARAENCVIAASRVVIDSASNCEIVADEVVIALAEGCAIAGHNVEIESAGPRKRIEMLIHVLVRDVGHFDQQLAELDARRAAQQQAMAPLQQEIERISLLPDVRRYLALAAKLRTHELTLTPEQGQFLRKIASAVGGELQELSRLTHERQIHETAFNLAGNERERLREQRRAAAGRARCGLHMVSGEVLVRTMPFHPDHGPLYLLPAKDIQHRLRGTAVAGKTLFAGSSGGFDWHLDADAE